LCEKICHVSLALLNSLAQPTKIPIIIMLLTLYKNHFHIPLALNTQKKLNFPTKIFYPLLSGQHETLPDSNPEWDFHSKFFHVFLLSGAETFSFAKSLTDLVGVGRGK
jgi:hypothetical protein